MSIIQDVNRFLNKTESIYERRKTALYALSLEYAARALNDFRRRQAQEEFWRNQTFTAMNLVFADAFATGNIIGWFMAHGVEYGVYLELANDGKNQALRPVVIGQAKQFFADAESLYKD